MNKAAFILNELPEPIASPEAINEVREELQAKAQEEATTAWTEAKTKIEEDVKANYREGKVKFILLYASLSSNHQYSQQLAQFVLHV